MIRCSLRLLAAILLLVSAPLLAQEPEFHCGANELDRMGTLIAGHPERIQEIDQAKAQLEHFTQTWPGDAGRDDGYVIPVVFHIIHNNGPENIGDDQVRDAIRVMNEDYNKMTPDWQEVQPEFLGIVADVGITFKLAQLDPAGNCTNGITRTVSELTYEGDQAMKNLVDWPRDRYLNIWVSASAGGPGVAGYSMYPSSVSGSWGAAADGIVILSDYVGSIGTSSPNRSHSLSHEAGHWLNLKHCWGDSNTPALPQNCGDDDAVADTPNTIGWLTCNLRGATCGSAVDNVENFMEYSYCSKMFTNGQKARMLAALNSSTASRNNLWTNANLALTGLSGPPQLCLADLHANKRVICAGTAVNFSDASYNGVTSWNWSFQGGIPATSESEAPVVTYDTPGTYDVSLTVGSGTQTMNTQRSQYIIVLPNNGAPLPFTEGFENTASLPSVSWMVNDINQDGTFQASGNAAYTGSRSVRLVNTASNSGNIDEMISNTIDLSGSGPTTISFRYAYAKRANSNNDVLRLYISKDCGETWSLKRALTAASLATAPVQGSSFTPNGPDQWGYSETSPISGDFLASNLRLKFWFQGGGGNNLWLDDININSSSTGIPGRGDTDALGMQVTPNPADGRAVLTARLPTAGQALVDVLDVTGRIVASVAEQDLPAGEAKWELPVGSLPSGIYMVRLRQQGKVQVVRLAKN